MTRRHFLSKSTSMACALAIPPSSALASIAQGTGHTVPEPLKRPKGPIDVAFLISDQFQMIDFAGPWEIFQDVIDPATHARAFKPYTVSRLDRPLKASGGLQVIPNYNFESAPQPHVLVIPAQMDKSKPVLNWIKKVSAKTDVTMSVCTGVFLLAEAGLLDGLEATTYHGACKLLAVEHPKVRVKNGVRFVDNGHVATSGGLSAGIDLALHVVARYFGLDVADTTSADLEYAGYGWKNPNETGDVFQRIAAADREKKKGLVCPVCGMSIMSKELLYRYKGKSYYFCSESCRNSFMKHPEKFIDNH